MALSTNLVSTDNVFSFPDHSNNITAQFESYSPTQQLAADAFQKILALSQDDRTTLPQLIARFEELKSSCYQYKFKYLLESQSQASEFYKVLKIKAQEAHRVVPPIEHSQFKEPCHLGFIREIRIVNHGPTIREKLLVDENARTILFIEEGMIHPEKTEGAFTAINQVIEEGGKYYFAGTYLYGSIDEDFDESKKDKEAMFRLTYDNMLKLMRNVNLEDIYKRLYSF
jgi:hypothetical protein